MDNKVLDEAVEAGWKAAVRYDDTPDGMVRLMTANEREAVKRTILAGVKVLLGEPVATLCYDNDDGWWIDWEGRSPESTEGIEVYAPSLGEGDGR